MDKLIIGDKVIVMYENKYNSPTPVSVICPSIFHEGNDICFRLDNGAYSCTCGCEFQRNSEFEWKITSQRIIR